MTPARLGTAALGMQVSFSLSLSFLPPATAVTVSFALPGLMPGTPIFSGTTRPGAVQPPVVGSSAASALCSAVAASPAGVTVGGASSGVAVQPADDCTVQAWRPNVQLPFATPSVSHEGSPSTQVSL